AAQRWLREPPESVARRSRRRPPDRRAAAATGQALVELRAVDLYRDYRPVLRDLYWTIGPGEHWAIVGRNGSGKSTLLRFLYGDLSAALGGHVVRRGHPAGTHIESWRRRIGFVSPELQAEYLDHISVADL